jgi:transketolase
MAFELRNRRSTLVDIGDLVNKGEGPRLDDQTAARFELHDLLYRSLCAMLYNYAPRSGHPGGSISSGRIATALLYTTMDYDIGDPDREDADVISYAAGHKALGLYALWALRDEILRVGAPDLLPTDARYRLRLEDLLGFRRSPGNNTPLFRRFGSKPLDGHPTPATPFVRLSTGASGVGVAASIGMAFAAKDYYGANAPRIQIIDGEGGLTPGRVAEAMAAAATARLDNVVLHVDWNQASIDSNRVTREDDAAGDYVQWTPAELAAFEDWNVVTVPNGMDFQQIVMAQRVAAQLSSRRPTAIVYRTTKGWRYGLEGRAAHGAGHALCSGKFATAVEPLLPYVTGTLPSCNNAERCRGGADREQVEQCYWEALQLVRRILESQPYFVNDMADRIRASRDRLNVLARRPRAHAPDLTKLFKAVSATSLTSVPADLTLTPGTRTTLRGEFAKALNFLNRKSDGAVLAAAADLLGSTNLGQSAAGFGEGFFNAHDNPGSRQLSIGGICEDAIACVATGVSSYGHHLAVCSSYAAFMAPLAHIPARLHAIANQMRQEIKKEPYKPVILLCAHAGLETGEDGPTHADPQTLQLFQDAFPLGTMVTLTPWDPQEIWPLLSTALRKRPAVIAPFINRPEVTVLDRQRLGLAPASDSVQGLYALRRAEGTGDGTIVLQGGAVTYEFLTVAWPRLQGDGIDLNVYYVSSSELFDLLPAADQELILPDEHASQAMGITGFSFPTMYKWIRSAEGRTRTLHPFMRGHYMGGGAPSVVLEQAGLDGESQYEAVKAYVDSIAVHATVGQRA